MSELYRAYVRSGRSDRLLTKEDYQGLGGVAGSLSQRADGSIEASMRRIRTPVPRDAAHGVAANRRSGASPRAAR